METATVSSVSEAITALRAIQAQHGDLPMFNEVDGPFQFTATIWSEEDCRKAGGDLQDGVTIDGVAVVRHGPVLPQEGAVMSNIDLWRENCDWLGEKGFRDDIGSAASALGAIKRMLKDINEWDDFQVEGLACLVE